MSDGKKEGQLWTQAPMSSPTGSVLFPLPAVFFQQDDSNKHNSPRVLGLATGLFLIWDNLRGETYECGCGKLFPYFLDFIKTAAM